jgi:hypothetical protein
VTYGKREAHYYSSRILHEESAAVTRPPRSCFWCAPPLSGENQPAPAPPHAERTPDLSGILGRSSPFVGEAVFDAVPEGDGDYSAVIGVYVVDDGGQEEKKYL